MAKFFVGQRVRIVRVQRRPEWLGAEARVTTIERGWRCIDTGREFYGAVGLDLTDGGRPVFAPTDWLEPILPEGAAPSEFTTLADLLASLEVTA